MVDEVRPACAGAASDGRLLGAADWDALAGRRRATVEALAERREAELTSDDADQHPVHERHDGLPQGRDARRTTTSSTTATSSAERCGYTEADRVCIPVPFYHCFGMVMGNLGCDDARRVHRDPGAGVRPRGDAARPSQEERCTSLYGVPTMFIAELAHPDFASFDLTSLRTGIMAGSPCPVEVMKRVVDRDAHGAR